MRGGDCGLANNCQHPTQLGATYVPYGQPASPMPWLVDTHWVTVDTRRPYPICTHTPTQQLHGRNNRWHLHWEARVVELHTHHQPLGITKLAKSALVMRQTSRHHSMGHSYTGTTGEAPYHKAVWRKPRRRTQVWSSCQYCGSLAACLHYKGRVGQLKLNDKAGA